jgi:hypothetical protein
LLFLFLFLSFFPFFSGTLATPPAPKTNPQLLIFVLTSPCAPNSRPRSPSCHTPGVAISVRYGSKAVWAALASVTAVDEVYACKTRPFDSGLDHTTRPHFFAARLP